MSDQNLAEKIKGIVSEFFEKMTLPATSITVNINKSEKGENLSEEREVIGVTLKSQDPQILIGQQGQTLFELQKLLKTLLNKKLGKVYYLSLDINDYKSSKIDYLESMVKELADEVAFTKIEKALPPMNSYERKIIHAKLSSREDIVSESQGDGTERHIIIKPK